MRNFLKALFARCSHKWIEERREDIRRAGGDKGKIGEGSYCRCEKCGERKLFTMVMM